MIKIPVFFFSLLLSCSLLAQDMVRIAVASNFYATMKTLTKDFSLQTGIKVSISNGATGSLYTQIKQGAPYDLFFSADENRPKLLEQQGLIEKNSRFTYATGRLVVWSPNPSKVSPNLADLKLNNPHFRFIAIANPKTAPYGLASIQILKYYGLYQTLKHNNKIAQGENIGKAYHYIASGNAQLGLVAKSYVTNPQKPLKGKFIEIDKSLYPTIKQQAVILKGKNSNAVKMFLKYFHSNKVQEKIQSYGYGI